MAIVHEAMTTSSSDTINKPTGTAVGDVLIATVMWYDGFSGTGSTISSTGFTSIVTAGDGNSRIAMFSRVVDGSEASTFTFTSSTTPFLACGMSRYSGVDTSNVIDASDASVSASISATHTAPSVTTATSNTYLIRAYGAGNSGTWGAISGYTQHLAVSDAGDAIALTNFGKEQAATGSTGTQNGTGPSAPWAAATVALKSLVPNIDSYIQVGADGSGKKKRTQTHTVSTQTVHTGYDIHADESGNRSRVLNAGPAVSDYGLVTRPLSLANGAVPVSFYATALAGLTTEALASLSRTRDFTTTAAATTQTVPAGKTMRIYGITGTVWRTTTTGALTWYLEINLRVNTGGTVTATSPIVATAQATWGEYATPAATVQFGSEPIWAYFPEGIEIPAGASFGLGYETGASIASRATVQLEMFGVEY